MKYESSQNGATVMKLTIIDAPINMPMKLSHKVLKTLKAIDVFIKQSGIKTVKVVSEKAFYEEVDK